MQKVRQSLNPLLIVKKSSFSALVRSKDGPNSIPSETYQRPKPPWEEAAEIGVPLTIVQEPIEPLSVAASGSESCDPASEGHIP